MFRYRLVLFVLLTMTALSACTSTSSAATQSTPSLTVTPLSSATAGGTPSPTATLSAGTALATADRYYQALEAHNYTAASAYLAPNATTVGGQKLTREMFIQLARSRDQEYGSITGFDSEADGSDPSMIILTISRTILQGYHSHLQFKQDSNSWKIVSIDVI